MKKYRFLLLCLILISTLRISSQSDQAFKMLNVNVVPMTDDIVLYRQDVTVANGKIVSIKPHRSEDVASGDTISYLATGKYLCPGWAEMHAHIPTPDEDGNTTQVHETLFLYLSQGITTIRGMLGHPSHLSLRADVMDKDLLSPRIYTSSPSMNGNSIPDEETARKKVHQYADDGYDFLKVHPGIKRSVFDAMVKAAAERSLPFAGHVPLDVGIEHALTSGYESVDHIDGYIEGLAPQDMRSSGGFFGVLLADQLDSTRITPLVRQTVDNAVAVVPTQTLFTRWLAPHALESLMQDSEMAYISPSRRFSWRQNKERMEADLELTEDQYAIFLDARQRLIREMDKQGTLLLLGSDAPQVMNVPGFSIHREMQSIADAGLSPYRILKSGTTNVAEYFGRSDEIGTIEPGMVADLVVLDQNPLEDIEHCQAIHAVIYRGNILMREVIDQRLAEIAKNYSE